MVALDYHDRTKHHFHRFARSVGYLDWASQPNPFRRFDGARIIPLSHTPLALDAPFEQLYRDSPPAPLNAGTLSEFLRCSLGLSAWKQYGASRWALRVNPSSGNLHPTEGYVVTGLTMGSGEDPAVRVAHYAPEPHALEERCVLDDRSSLAAADWSNAFLVGLTSIHWREAWKYGERAFRYCQHDTGHAIAALRFAAALFGWRLTLLPRWSDADVAALLGVEVSSSNDSGPADDPEREWPDCLAIVSRGVIAPSLEHGHAPLVTAARSATWQGAPNRLSRTRVGWPIIDDVATATLYPGGSPMHLGDAAPGAGSQASPAAPGTGSPESLPLLARSIILQRRSAVAFDGHGSLSKAAFVSMLQRLKPTAPPWDAIWWPPHVHLALFVHRVDGVLPGMYAFMRDGAAVAPLRAACREDFLWEAVPAADGLFLLAPFDCRAIARRLSCDQDIAADGFFGMAMLARFEESLQGNEWFYRNLFWETGMIGQVLYLEAEAAGARATGIGCYYDDPVHDLLGISGRQWQSLYHFSMGMPVDDDRLTTEPGYPWERGSSVITKL